MLAYKQGLTNSANTLLRVIISSMIFALYDIFGIKEDSLDSCNPCSKKKYLWSLCYLYDL